MSFFVRLAGKADGQKSPADGLSTYRSIDIQLGGLYELDMT
jgi:hypothetical protein